MRLDQVTFPPGAVAYRHVHAGSGFRYLTVGQLEVASDHHIETAVPGDSWFEPAQSPVRATASLDHLTTSFVRFMVLPVAFEGRPSIQILDPSEAAMPRLQQTYRHFEHILSLA